MILKPIASIEILYFQLIPNLWKSSLSKVSNNFIVDCRTDINSLTICLKSLSFAFEFFAIFSSSNEIIKFSSPLTNLNVPLINNLSMSVIC
ncbi:hypothetical protein D3C84_1093120 [compost metagenome]